MAPDKGAGAVILNEVKDLLFLVFDS